MKTFTFTNEELNTIMDGLNNVIEKELELENNGPTTRGVLAFEVYEKIEERHTYKAERKIVPIK